MHSYNQFHAAGHGTFFSGQLSLTRNGEVDFLWVYDCGSDKSLIMNTLVQDLRTHAKTDLINMLCLSHFDDDHVNGLLELLRVFRVDRLFLPYLPFKRRLQIACEIDPTKAVGMDTLLFTLDPSGFLASSGFADRVKSIVLVQGGRKSRGNPSTDIDDLPMGPPHNEEVPSENPVDATQVGGEYAPLLVGGKRPWVAHVSHATPITWRQTLWEFVFYNKELKNGRAPAHGVSLATVQAQVKVLLGTVNLMKRPTLATAKWRDDLRDCYVHNFGTASKRKNDISLCVLSRPLAMEKIAQCQLFGQPFAGLGCAHTLVPVTDESKSGLLLTGDITINVKRLVAMKAHFNSARWNDIHVMQIPHHGSKDSWKTGCSGGCHHQYSVFCVPDVNPSGLRPHHSVVTDLAGRHPLYANYSASVVYCFHDV